MGLIFLVKGMLIGFSIAAPVGPIGVLCIRRTLSNGRAAGFVSGLGAETADAMYGLIAGFGLTAISEFLVNQQLFLKLIGGMFLLYLGFKTVTSIPVEKPISAKATGLMSDYLSTFALTSTNPVTILSFIAIFSGLGMGEIKGNYISSLLIVLGVFLGSAAWWLLLSSGVGFFRKSFNTKGLRYINIISGIIILTFGLLAIWSIFS
jgi:threonine/homoserine/homoserine lactone efflux protein